jgi:hypothetical protein
VSGWQSQAVVRPEQGESLPRADSCCMERQLRTRSGSFARLIRRPPSSGCCRRWPHPELTGLGRIAVIEPPRRRRRQRPVWKRPLNAPRHRLGSVRRQLPTATNQRFRPIADDRTTEFPVRKRKLNVCGRCGQGMRRNLQHLIGGRGTSTKSGSRCVRRARRVGTGSANEDSGRRHRKPEKA